jgi:hypothetical protein
VSPLHIVTPTVTYEYCALEALLCCKKHMIITEEYRSERIHAAA